MDFAKQYAPKEAEPRLQKFWEQEGIYRFSPDSDKPLYSIDTPPPTVSGKMHIGHAFSFTQADIIARYKRMSGFNLFYPFGTDDNGLATDRLVESMNKVRSKDMKRPEYIKLALETLDRIRPDFIEDWKRIATSCDFSIFYSTINDHCRAISQESFIGLYNDRRAYRSESPSLWCPECHTAIAQVELEDRELESTFNDVVFTTDGKELIIATTRPELLPSCVAVIVHPDDKRYQKLAGRKAKVPLFGQEVPIISDERANPEKGTGIVMCCTFGDQTDMEWWKAYKLPLRISITEDGKLNEHGQKYKGLTIREARKKITEELKACGLLKKQEHIRHAVNVHERCGTEIEFLVKKQWFIKVLDLREKLLEQGARLNWYPEHMRNRYDNWAKGLQWDWSISRQRYFGIPFPVWYCRKCDEPILADTEKLPVDPMEDEPGKPCPKCHSEEFTAETDVMDTWATSSLTPKLAARLFIDKPVYRKLLPMNLRPQAHDIISFWLFNTVVKSYLHDKELPWHDVMISGWALDPKGKKMSKSKGNVIDPRTMLEKYSADALRFWASSSKLGEDLAFSEKEFVTGTKTITKLWNASRFVLMNLKDYRPGGSPKPQPIDAWLLSKMNRMIKEVTESYNKYEYIRGRLDVEKFFWHDFTDYYIEMVKDRLYNPGNYSSDAVESAKYTLYQALTTLVKMFAPIMPHVTEEIYQNSIIKDIEGEKSIHVAPWPEADESLVNEYAEKAGELAKLVIDVVRKAKSLNQWSMKEPLGKIVIACNSHEEEALKSLEPVLKATGRIEKVEYSRESSEESQSIEGTGMSIEIIK